MANGSAPGHSACSSTIRQAASAASITTVPAAVRATNRRGLPMNVLTGRTTGPRRTTATVSRRSHLTITRRSPAARRATVDRAAACVAGGTSRRRASSTSASHRGRSVPRRRHLRADSTQCPRARCSPRSRRWQSSRRTASSEFRASPRGGSGNSMTSLALAACSSATADNSSTNSAEKCPPSRCESGPFVTAWGCSV